MQQILESITLPISVLFLYEMQKSYEKGVNVEKCPFGVVPFHFFKSSATLLVVQWRRQKPTILGVSESPHLGGKTVVRVYLTNL